MFEENLSFQTLFRDQDFLVLNKPAGLPVHSTVDSSRPSIVSILESERCPYLHLVHRLDVQTSGVLILAKSPEACSKMQSHWSRASKTYLCLVRGLPESDFWECVTHLKDRGRGKVEVVRSGGKTSMTLFTKLQSAEELLGKQAASLAGLVSGLEAKLATGRRHQIRVQLANLGLPIIGDNIYAPSGVAALARRSLLHCRNISIETLGIEVTAPVPYDMLHFWQTGHQ